MLKVLLRQVRNSYNYNYKSDYNCDTISTILLQSLLTLIIFLVNTNAWHITSATAAQNLKLSVLVVGLYDHFDI